MSEDYQKKTIKREASAIKAKLEGAYIFGRPVDMTDNDSLIVAAYYMATQTRSIVYQQQIDRVFDMFGVGTRVK